MNSHVLALATGVILCSHKGAHARKGVRCGVPGGMQSVSYVLRGNASWHLPMRVSRLLSRARIHTQACRPKLIAGTFLPGYKSKMIRESEMIKSKEGKTPL